MGFAQESKTQTTQIKKLISLQAGDMIKDQGMHREKVGGRSAATVACVSRETLWQAGDIMAGRRHYGREETLWQAGGGGTDIMVSRK